MAARCPDSCNECSITREACSDALLNGKSAAMTAILMCALWGYSQSQVQVQVRGVGFRAVLAAVRAGRGAVRFNLCPHHHQ